MSCLMGQPFLHGAVKQSNSGSGFPILRAGCGFTGLVYSPEAATPSSSAFTAAASTPLKRSLPHSIRVSAIWVSRWYPPGFNIVVAIVIGQMPALKRAAALAFVAPPE